MKKLNTFLLAALASLFAMLSCGSSSDSDDSNGNGGSQEVSVTLSVTEISAAAPATSVNVQVQTSAREWTAYTLDESWMKVKADAATSSIGIDIAENTGAERTGTVVFKSGSTRKNITVKQAAPLVVGTKSLYFTKDGGEKTVSVSYAGEWTATASDEWIDCKKEGSTLVVSVEANKTENRKGAITISTTDETAVVEVEQGGEEAYNCPLEGYHLVWNDEFDQESTDLSRNWTHEVKGDHWVNNELQNYVNKKSPNGQRVTEVTDGTLKIHCFKENGKVYSGRVYGKKNTGWQYGYVEASIKLPSGKGTWPAFWMMPVKFTSWPADGEIDIMEEVGYHKDYVSSSLHATGHVHSNGTQITKEVYCKGAEGEFHTYGMEWTKDYFQFYVDGKKTLYYRNPGTGKVDWPYDAAFYVILNLAWGGDWGGSQGVDESKLPVTMEIDYVRVFQKN